MSDHYEFPRDVIELLDLLLDEPRQRGRAVTGNGIEQLARAA
jgi:hypothetical protein